MRPELIATAAFCVVLMELTGCAATQAGQSPETDAVPVKRGAFSGTTQQTNFYYSVNPDCTSGGIPAVKIKQAPSHGTVEIQEGSVYPEFPRSNQNFLCNKTKTPGVIVTYTSEAAYKGEDAFVLETVFPHGKLQLTPVQMTVD